MFDWRRPISHEQNGPAASGMLLHAFMHESVAYEVRFARLDGQSQFSVLPIPSIGALYAPGLTNSQLTSLLGRSEAGSLPWANGS